MPKSSTYSDSEACKRHMAPIQPPAFTNTHCSSSSGSTWPGCSLRSSTISREKASSWSSPDAKRSGVGETSPRSGLRGEGALGKRSTEPLQAGPPGSPPSPAHQRTVEQAALSLLAGRRSSAYPAIAKRPGSAPRQQPEIGRSTPTAGPRPTASRRASWHHQRRRQIPPQVKHIQTQNPLPTVAPAAMVRLAWANRNVRGT